MLGEHIQSADWKKEKHVPVIEASDAVEAGEFFDVKVTLGKEVGHPNTTEHHIAWAKLYFKPADGNFIYDVAHFEFNAHGASTKGANEGPVYTHHTGATEMKIDQAGALIAVSYCNIHGLWESSQEIKVV